MIEFQGNYFDGKTSRSLLVTITLAGENLTVRDRKGVLICTAALRDIEIDPPLGKTARLIRFRNRAVCETGDHAAIAALEKAGARKHWLELVHFLEKRWKGAAISIVSIVLCVWLFQVYVFPFLAKELALSIPNEVAGIISDQTMNVIDKRFLHESELDNERIAELQHSFRRLVAETGEGGFDYELVLRKSSAMGPNAFALPSGMIVMTDGLVKRAGSDKELDAVLLHEIAHVRGRHALRMVFQDAGIFLIVSALAGDLSGISSAAASLPTVLAQTGYSREFEREADQFAALHLADREHGVKPFQDILRRLGENSAKIPGESLLSTHPVIEERIRNLEEAAERFKSLR